MDPSHNNFMISTIIHAPQYNPTMRVLHPTRLHLKLSPRLYLRSSKFVFVFGPTLPRTILIDVSSRKTIGQRLLISSEKIHSKLVIIGRSFILKSSRVWFSFLIIPKSMAVPSKQKKKHLLSYHGHGHLKHEL